MQSLYISEVPKSKINDKNLKRISDLSSLGSSSFKVAVISDSHDYYSSLKKQVDYINKYKEDISFVVHTGDATNLGLVLEWQMFDQFMSQLKIPYLLVIGNHDILSNGKKIYQQMYGSRLNFSFVFKQTKFILFNNNNWESEGDVPDMNFLENELNSSSVVHNIFMAHVQGDDSDRYSNSKIQEMKSLVSTYNVKYFLNGHNHNASESNFAGSVRLTVGSSVKGKLLVLSFTNGGVTHEYVSP